MTAKEKNENRTELVFILDKSGSMGGLESDTIGGFNSILTKQRKGQGRVTVTTVLFDDKYELLHDRFDIEEIKPITDEDYYVEGCTALLDAMGKTITKIKNVQKNVEVKSGTNNVLFVIITDGMENASSEYDSSAIKQMVKTQKQRGWEFLFLGANIDAVETAKNYGISPERAANYHADSLGTTVNFTAVAEVISSVRSKGRVTESWKKSIERDFSER